MYTIYMNIKKCNNLNIKEQFIALEILNCPLISQLNRSPLF